MDGKLDQFGDAKILLGSRGHRNYQLGIWTFETYPFKYLIWALKILGSVGLIFKQG